MERGNSCERIIDANLNRVKEALRVVEDIVRFNYDDFGISSTIKELRLSLGVLASQYYEAIEFRDTTNDVLTSITSENEKKRNSLFEIIKVNFKRSEESLRVLEEVFKLIDNKASATCKQARYKTYILESQVYDKYSKH